MAISYADLKRPSEDFFYTQLFNPYYSQKSTIYWSAIATSFDYADVTFIDPSGRAETLPTAGHGSIEIDFIRKVFKEIDNILEVDFVESSPEAADIVIVSTYKDLIYEWDPGTAYAGVAHMGHGLNQDTPRLGVAAWRDYTGKGDLSIYERKTIIHEIGHLLGLTHPGAGSAGGRAGGDNPEWNQKDSIMSYNWVNGQVSQFFTPLDVQALQSIWKPETDEVVIGWPAINYFPAEEEPVVVEPPVAIQALSTGVTENNSSSVLSEMDDLAAQLVNRQWKDHVSSLIGGDNGVDVYIDAKARFRSSKPIKKLGKSVTLGTSEVEFISNILGQVDELTGLSVNVVKKPAKADIVYSSLRMKKWENHIEDVGGYHHSVWLAQGKPGVLTEFEQVLITQSVLTSLGMGWSTTKQLSTFDTVLSWNGEDYFGITQADAKGLQILWGEPV